MQPQHRHVIAERVDDALRLGQTVAHAPRAQHLEPVSYTHLRAHETVLDLVCRLLLEKKKTLYDSHTLTVLRYT